GATDPYPIGLVGRDDVARPEDRASDRVTRRLDEDPFRSIAVNEEESRAAGGESDQVVRDDVADRSRRDPNALQTVPSDRVLCTGLLCNTHRVIGGRLDQDTLESVSLPSEDG